MIDIVPQVTSQRYCPSCKEWKDLTAEFFVPMARCKDGFRPRCRDCDKRIPLPGTKKERSTYKRGKNQDPNEPIPLKKPCNTCGEEKTLDQFGTQKHGRYGVRAVCNECRKNESTEFYTRRYGLKRKQLPEPVNGGKVCRRCEIEKPFSEFGKTSRPRDSKDGHQAQCKQCKKEVQELNHTPEESNERARQWREENLEYANERARQWKRDHPLEVRQMNARREAIKKSFQGADEVDYGRILERDGAWCYICETPIDLTIKGKNRAALAFDHVIPLQPREGEPQGTHTPDNLRPAHQCCNGRKGNIPFELLTPRHRRGLD